MKLKTLKELEFKTGIGNAVDPIKLRQEAKKWIESMKISDCLERPRFCDEYGCDESFVDWIKQFFNLEETNERPKKD